MNQYIVQVERWSDREVQTYTIPAADEVEATKTAMDSFFLANPGDKGKLRGVNPALDN